MYTQDHFKRDRYEQNGFIDDFQAYTLGYETTNLFAFWTAVHGISSTIKRQASLTFGDGLFPNFFVILVAPPAVVRKTTALQRFDSLESRMWEMNKDEQIEKLYRTLPIRGKATPEQMFNSMKNEKVFVGEEEYMSDAALVPRIDELSVFLSKAQYNQGQIDKLTDFYDCKSHDTDSTIARGSKEIFNIFCTLLGCTTPDHFKGSIPETAFGGGFMSRCTIVSEDLTHRILPVPYTPADAPDKDEMANRLMWILRNKKGTYKFTAEAFDAYKEWYRKDIMHQRYAALEINADHREARKGIHILKLALILAIQRYDLVKEITLEDFKRALDIVEYTNATSSDMLEDISMNVREDGRFYKFRRLVKEAGEHGITRAELARKYGFKKQETDQYVDELRNRKEVKLAGVRLVYYKQEKESE